MTRIRFQRSLRFHADAAAVWRLLSDTDRLNREMDLPTPVFRFEPRKLGGTYAFAEARLGPLVFRYREHAFQWVAQRHYSIRRSFQSGPIGIIDGSVELEPEGAETCVRLTTEVECRYFPLFSRILGLKTIRDFEKACAGFERFLTGESVTPYPKEVGRPPVDEGRLTNGMQRLSDSGFNAEHLAIFERFLRNSPPADLVHFRPTETATKLGLPCEAFLELCLTATKIGLTDLRWRLMCPSCRSNQETFSALNQIENRAHCEACNIRFDSRFDENVEVAFSVAHTIRPIIYGSYCIGGPQLAPHVVAQIILNPGENRTIQLELEPGIWQVQSPQSSSSPIIQVRQGDDSECDVTLGQAGISVDAAVWASRQTLHFQNDLSEEAIVRVVAGDWRARATTAAHVTSLQRFRDQFSSQVLAPQVELSVSQVCILFTDLKGSTQMYRVQGDAESYGRVRVYFQRLKECISRHNGAIVKTIGDAVMASFIDPANAVHAALEIQSTEDDLVTRIGLHWGPAIAVNANDTLDYFGRTVNLASRLEKKSFGGDIVLAASAADDPAVKDVIIRSGCRVERFDTSVPDVDDSMALVRLIP